MIKGIIFDCFGVMLADVLKARLDSISRIDPEKGRQLQDIVQASNRGMISREESAKQMAEILEIDHEEILTAADKGEVKNEELMAFAKSLRPEYKVAMLSNVRGRFRLEERISSGELDETFDVVVASGDVGFIKPEGQIYELTAEKLGVSPYECVMIDDVAAYCEGAEAVGMRSIQFVSNDQVIADLRALLADENT